MVIEVYSFLEGFRFVDKMEYSDYLQWEKDLMILKLEGRFVGYKQYDISMADFNKLSEIQRNNMPCKAVFDREAYVSQRKH
jgi:hypothetical protein